MICPKCNHINHPNARYCSHCGNNIIPATTVTTEISGSLPKTIIFFTLLLTYITSMYFIDIGLDYRNHLIFDAVFAGLILFFFFLNFKEMGRLFNFSNPRPGVLALISTGAPVLAIIIFFLANFINLILNNQVEISEFYIFQDSPAPFTLTILSTSVFPAVFEEIACRGILFNYLEPHAGKRPTILITAIVFSLLHFSLISLLWLLPIGYLFGYLRARYNTLWYGIIGHFLYNASITLYSIFFF